MIILASGSPRRKQLLKKLGVEFIVDASNIDEILNPRLKPRRQAEVLSLQKAEAIAEKYKEKDAIIIAADSLVTIDGEILGKPKDVKDAKRMLQLLSNKQHLVYTGFTIMDSKKSKLVTKSSETKVTFKKLTPKEITSYLSQKEPYDKAGAYALQGVSAVFIERIEGDFYGAVGLPLHLLSEELKKFGVHILS